MSEKNITIGGLTVVEFGTRNTDPWSSSCIMHCKDSGNYHYILNCEIGSNGIGFFISHYDISKLGKPNVKSADWKRKFYKTINRDNFREIILNKNDYNFISDYLTCGSSESKKCSCCNRENVKDWFYYNGFRCRNCLEKIKDSENWKY